VSPAIVPGVAVTVSTCRFSVSDTTELSMFPCFIFCSYTASCCSARSLRIFSSRYSRCRGCYCVETVCFATVLSLVICETDCWACCFVL